MFGKDWFFSSTSTEGAAKIGSDVFLAAVFTISIEAIADPRDAASASKGDAPFGNDVFFANASSG